MNIIAYLQSGPKQLYNFQHTISLELFKKKIKQILPKCS